VTGLVDKRILLGVSGGIAAYKAAELVRLMRARGARVRVVMTEAASAFVTPLTFQALSGEPVRQTLLGAEQESAMGHIELARWADLVLVAPATADCIARLAQGMANDLLSSLCLAREAPIALAPAMNQAMWRNPATRHNSGLLEARGVRLWGPAQGEQACGEIGPGRMLEPSELLRRVEATLEEGPLRGVRVMVTAGPTREPLDPVRFLSNRSSGRMGYALASAFEAAGASVDLVSGPVCLESPPGVQCIRVETAHQMREAVLQRLSGLDIFVACAAVADYRPAQAASVKIKKGPETLSLSLTRNPDILAEVAAGASRPFCVGFAAETERVVEQAQAKRRAKGLDMIAANRVGDDRGGFEDEDNALILLWDGGRRDLPMAPKISLARDMVEQVAERYHAVISAQPGQP
jgi:phosphopantothenoylcysteine decarboxylase/phosphopantothenate--cysteine ligase